MAWKEDRPRPFCLSRRYGRLSSVRKLDTVAWKLKFANRLVTDFFIEAEATGYLMKVEEPKKETGGWMGSGPIVRGDRKPR